MTGKNPLSSFASLAAKTEMPCGVLDCRKVRTSSITCRAKYHASATAPVRVNLYFSPDSKNYDTIPYTFFDVNLTAGSECQETAIIDFPEHGYMQVEVKNTDATYSATNIQVWDTIIKWKDEEEV